MKTPEAHPREQDRIVELIKSGHFLSAAERRFDMITAAARDLLNVPIVLISLISEDQQWFKSTQGLCVPATEKDISFCGHAILQNGVFEIPDALLDNRFKDNPLVTGPPYIRFYAGVPIKSVNKLPLGTLCIIDRVPRKLDNKDVSTLLGLANNLEAEMHRRGLSETELDYLVANNLQTQSDWLDENTKCWTLEAGFALVTWHLSKVTNYTVGGFICNGTTDHYHVFANVLRKLLPNNTTLFTDDDVFLFFSPTTFNLSKFEIIDLEFKHKLKLHNLTTPASFKGVFQHYKNTNTLTNVLYQRIERNLIKLDDNTVTKIF